MNKLNNSCDVSNNYFLKMKIMLSLCFILFLFLVNIPANSYAVTDFSVPIVRTEIEVFLNDSANLTTHSFIYELPDRDKGVGDYVVSLEDYFGNICSKVHEVSGFGNLGYPEIGAEIETKDSIILYTDLEFTSDCSILVLRKSSDYAILEASRASSRIDPFKEALLVYDFSKNSSNLSSFDPIQRIVNTPVEEEGFIFTSMYFIIFYVIVILSILFGLIYFFAFNRKGEV